MTIDARKLGYAFLRLTTGLVFFFYGVEKLRMGPAQFAAGLVEGFSKTWLPSFSVRAFGLALPFLELVCGALLAVGFSTRFGLAVACFLLVLLTTGQAISGHADGVAHNLIYA